MFASGLENENSALLADETNVPTVDPRTLTETPAETLAREAGEQTLIQNQAELVPQATEYLCKESELTPQEAQGIIDLLKDGFTGNAINGETLSDENRDTLATNEIILQNPANESEAVNAQVPNQKFGPGEISQFLNNYIDGPFSFGVVLEDSLRTGRCETFSSADCALNGPNLKFRNSGTGIIEDIKPIKEVFTGFFDGNENLTQFTKEENDVLRTAFNTDQSVNDDNTLSQTQIKTAKRLEKELIPNSILTQEFNARLQTNCQNSSCVISTYSLFDKYFNTWMSSEMVVSTFGPSLLYQTKKLFGWNARRGFLTGVKEGYQDFLDKFRSRFVTPESFLGNLRTKRIRNILDKNGWRDWFLSMTSGKSDGTGYHLFKTEEFQSFWGKQSAKGGFLDRVQTLEQKSDFIRMLKDMRSFLRAAKARNDLAQNAYKTALQNPALGPDSPVTKKLYIDWGRDTAKWMDEVYDDGLGADYIEWMVRHPDAGFFNKGVLQVRPDGGSEVIDLFTEHRNMQRIMKKFGKDGSFRNFENESLEYGTAFQSRGDDLIYYTFDRDTAHNYRGLSYSNLAAAAPGAARRETWVQTDLGDFVPYKAQSVPFIQNRIAGNPQIFEGNWKEAGVFTPEQITRRITNARTGPGANMKFGSLNTEQMLETVRERNWVSRRYWNSLDKLMAQEDELIRSYFSIKGGAKWTALPFGYWWAKKGFGIEGISQYQLPDTWHDLKFTHGSENVYDYAYIDFFANEGSDQGDLFLRVINSLPWKLILDEVSDKYNPIKNLYDSLTQNQLRDETEDLAFYLTAPDNCVNCSMVINSTNMNEFNPFFFVDNQKLTSYILEDTRTPEAREKGQTLIAFAGHMNLEGESGDDKGEPINLIEAITDDEIKTCTEAIQGLEFYGLNIGKILPKDASVGAVLGGLESVTYGLFFWAGIFSTAAIQIVIAPQLHDCVDVDEGYFAHYFVPVQKTQDKQSGTEEKSTEKVSEVTDNLKNTLLEPYKGDQNTFVKQSISELGEELDKFVKDSKSNDIVQATLTVNGLNSGQIESRALFYFWCGKGCEIKPSAYRTDGSEQIKGVNDANVNIDFEKGEITANGKPIVQNQDIVRLASTNLGIPAVEIPHSITETCIAPTTNVAIEVNAQGETRVLNNDLLNCVRQGVLEQTGLPMESGTNKLNDVFGPLELVVTTTHPNIRPLGDKILAEGVPRKIAEGSNAKITILDNKDVNLSSSNDGATELGRLQSLQFANGSLIVKPNGCFITWLRHHEQGILPKDLVEGLGTDVDRVYNEQTMCEEPAVNFTLSGDPNSDAKDEQVQRFNDSLAHMGPFTIFETPTQRFVISAEKNEQGVCKDHLRIIDKATGKVEDLTGVITQTPDGFKITTDDGKVKEIKFSEKDGAPFIQVDDNKPEVLTSAQGKNGSFYYDPETGLWYAENGQLLPLIEAFREGIAAKVGPNGEVTATASGNALTVNLGKEDSGFLNLPSLPEEKALLAIMLLLLITVFVQVQRRKRKV